MLDYKKLEPLKDVVFGIYKKVDLKNESWPTASFNDEHATVYARINYRCPDRDSYEWLNFLVSVWHKANYAMFTCPTYAELEPRIARAVADMDGMCQHTNRKELSQMECLERGIPHYGACWHVTECLDCGMIQSVDSSG